MLHSDSLWLRGCFYVLMPFAFMLAFLVLPAAAGPDTVPPDGWVGASVPGSTEYVELDPWVQAQLSGESEIVVPLDAWATAATSERRLALNQLDPWARAAASSEPDVATESQPLTDERVASRDGSWFMETPVVTGIGAATLSLLIGLGLFVRHQRQVTRLRGA